MTNKTNGRFDIDFKKMIVELYENGDSVSKLCREYDLKEGTVYPWISQYSKGGARGNASKEPNQYATDDYAKMQKELKELKQENEILKKCVSIFSTK